MMENKTVVQVGDLLLVKVPEDFTKAAIIDGCIVDNWADEEWIPIEKLPPGSWHLIGLASGIGEVDAIGLVEDWGGGYKDYQYQSDHGETYFPFLTALESLSSLLKSHNCDPATTIILKRK